MSKYTIQLPKARKIKLIEINIGDLKSLLTVGDKNFKVISGIPKAAVLSFAGIRPEYNAVILYVEHDSFDVVQGGDMISFLPIVIGTEQPA